MKRVGVVVLLVAAAGAGVLSWRRPLEPRRPARPNVLLVTVDTLRADRLGAYGATFGATPSLDRLATRGVRFATAIAHAPLTAPSHASILTGLLPPRHGVRENGAFVLPAGLPTLAERFAAEGYRTAAFVSGFPLDHRFGLGRGFVHYDDQLPHGSDPRRAPYVERPGDATTEAARRWIRGAGGSWCAWIHYFDPHAPYEAPTLVAARFPGHPYEAEIAFVDASLGDLLDELETREPGRTLVLVTADHGEGLGDHGEATHGVFLYDSTLRVPFLLAGPGVDAGRVVETVARGVDVLPTLLDLAGLPPLPASDGRSLRPAIEGRAMADAPTYSESLFASLNLGWAPLHSWRTRSLKLIAAPVPELFDLASDPHEEHDLAATRPESVTELERPLHAALAAPAPDAASTQSPDAAERLRALGYLAGSAPTTRRSLRDPKAGREILQLLERGLAEARANPGMAIDALSAVLAAEPDMPLARRYRAIAFQMARRHREALADLKRLESNTAPNLEDLILLGETQRLAGDKESALATFDRALRFAPGAPEPLLFRARALRALERRPEAEAGFEAVLAVDPNNAEARRGLGELALAAGDVDRAGSLYERLLSDDSQDVGAMIKLGVVRVRSQRLPEALRLFEAAVALEPRNAEALVDLAGALAKSGRPAEAVSYFERALTAGGETTSALNGLGFARLEAGDGPGGLRALRRSLSLDPHQAPLVAVVKELSR